MTRSSTRCQRERTRTTHSFRVESVSSLHYPYSSYFTPIHYRLVLITLLITPCLAARAEISGESRCQRGQCLVKIALRLYRGLRYSCLYLRWCGSLCHFLGGSSDNSHSA